MTYGWAILIILVMIAALVYFGVFNPSKLTPERCQAEPGFGCSDYQIKVGEAHFKIQNAKGDSLTVQGGWAINSSAPSLNCGCTTGISAGSSWASDVVMDVDCTGCTALNTAVGDRQKLTMSGYYQAKGGSFTKVFRLDTSATVSS